MPQRLDNQGAFSRPLSRFHFHNLFSHFHFLRIKTIWNSLWCRLDNQGALIFHWLATCNLQPNCLLLHPLMLLHQSPARPTDLILLLFLFVLSVGGKSGLWTKSLFGGGGLYPPIPLRWYLWTRYVFTVTIHLPHVLVRCVSDWWRMWEMMCTMW